MRKLLVYLAVPLGLLVIFASVAMANDLTGGSGTVNCTGYTLTFNFMGLTPSTAYQAQYNLTVTCGGTAYPVSGTYNFTSEAVMNQNESETDTVTTPTITWTTAGVPVTTGCTVAGSAYLVGGENYCQIGDTQYDSCPEPLSFTGSITCPSTNSACTTGANSLGYNVSESPSNQSEIVWFNSHFKLQGNVPSTGFTVDVTGQTITFGTSTLSVPDAVITFSSTASCSSTSFDTTLNQWETTVPLSYATHADEIFSSGLAYVLPAGFPQNVKNVVWTATFSSPEAPSLQFQFQYGAANYLSSDTKGDVFPMTAGDTPDYNAMMIDPVHNAPTCANYNNGDHSGTPEDQAVKNLVTGGGSGGGGSNWTGSWSSTPTYVCAAPGSET